LQHNQNTISLKSKQQTSIMRVAIHSNFNKIIGICLLVGLAACQSNEKKANTKEDSKRVTTKDVEAGIRDHINKQTEAGEGVFHFKSEDKEYNLKLVRVHTEYLSVLGASSFFACVDLADENGDVYDVDFFLDGKPGNMKVTQTAIHKLNGKPQYTWKQAKDKTWFTVPVKESSNALLGVIENEDNFEFTYEAKIPEITEAASMWIPIAKDDLFQTIKIKSIDAPVKHQMLKDKEFGNTVLFLELNSTHSGKQIAIVYDVKRKEKGPYVDDKSDSKNFLAASELIPVGGRFNEIVASVLKGKKTESKLMNARTLYDYIIEDMRYAKQGKYGTGDANFACDSRSGNCTEFHSFFISLARTAGIPARFAIGAAIPSERNEGGVNGYHCWAEFYADGKWWPIDISEGNKYTALATYYFGHHPANRIELSKGRDLQLTPGPKSGPIKFHAYPVFEMGDSQESVKTTFSFNRKS
jgi:hypothetical protein